MFDGVATPGVWSRVEQPLARALEELSSAGALGKSVLPQRWVSLHYGRIALNAHGWALLGASLQGTPLDPTLFPPPVGRIGPFLERGRRLLGPFSRPRVRARVRRARRTIEAALKRVEDVAARDLELPELARGPLDERAWTGVLLVWLARELLRSGDPAARLYVARALRLEGRFTGVLGKRLMERGVLERASDSAYLTVEERLAAVHDPSSVWARHLGDRVERVQQFLALDVPQVFWGSPRVTPVENG